MATMAVCMMPTAAASADGGKVFNAVVATDGTGDFASVQQAIDAAPAGRTSPWLIFVKAGSYKEVVSIPRTSPSSTS